MVPLPSALDDAPDGHMFLSGYDGQWFFMDPNGPVNTRRSASRGDTSGSRRARPRELRVVQRLLRPHRLPREGDGGTRVGGDVFQSLLCSLQREAGRWVENHGMCMAVVYWMCLCVA